MAIRQATTTDAATIKAIFDTFRIQIGTDFAERDVARYRQMLADPTRFYAIDTTRNAVACVRRIEPRREYMVDLLLPRGLTVPQLKPVLVRALQEQLATHPTEGAWRIWAEFLHSRDAQGALDGGAYQCREWKSKAFAGASVGQINGVWVIAWTLAEAAA